MQWWKLFCTRTCNRIFVAVIWETMYFNDLNAHINHTMHFDGLKVQRDAIKRLLTHTHKHTHPGEWWVISSSILEEEYWKHPGLAFLFVCFFTFLCFLWWDRQTGIDERLNPELRNQLSSEAIVKSMCGRLKCD